jgi:hypothetical protein
VEVTAKILMLYLPHVATRIRIPMDTNANPGQEARHEHMAAMMRDARATGR